MLPEETSEFSTEWILKKKKTTSLHGENKRNHPVNQKESIAALLNAISMTSAVLLSSWLFFPNQCSYLCLALPVRKISFPVVFPDCSGSSFTGSSSDWTLIWSTAPPHILVYSPVGTPGSRRAARLLQDCSLPLCQDQFILKNVWQLGWFISANSRKHPPSFLHCHRCTHFCCTQHK